MFCDYQINLRNTVFKEEGRDIQYFGKGGRSLYGGLGGLDNHLETMLYYVTLISL